MLDQVELLAVHHGAEATLGRRGECELGGVGRECVKCVMNIHKTGYNIY